MKNKILKYAQYNIYIFINVVYTYAFFFFSYKRELPELITTGNKYTSKDAENKSNSLLQDKLNKCNKLIDVLRRENLQQKSEVYVL